MHEDTPQRPHWANAVGMELRSGHVHLDRYSRSPAPSLSHRPVTGKKKSRSVTGHASNPEMARLPELPRLRALENHAAEVPVSASSAASSASPRSGSSRVHPYNTAGEVVEGSSFEIELPVHPGVMRAWK